jgi:hypothetical protein
MGKHQPVNLHGPNLVTIAACLQFKSLECASMPLPQLTLLRAGMFMYKCSQLADQGQLFAMGPGADHHQLFNHSRVDSGTIPRLECIYRVACVVVVTCLQFYHMTSHVAGVMVSPEPRTCSLELL